MITSTTRHGSHTAHQTVTEDFIEVASGSQSIRIGFTDQKISGRAGLSTFCGFLGWHRFGDLLAGLLPTRAAKASAGRGGRPPQPAQEIALGFLAGILSGAQRLAHIAWLRADPMLCQLLAVRQIASQSTLSRFFALFRHAGVNQRAFTPLWRWAMMRLPSWPGGYSLDLDSTRLLHEDGHQEGVAVGYTRMGHKPCLHPLLAVLEEAKLVVGFWLRPGNSSCAHNVIAFTLDLLGNLPRHIRLRMVRADSGFCGAPWLALLESQNLRYIVVARLLKPLQRLCRKETIWQRSEVPGTEVAEVWHEEIGSWKAAPPDPDPPPGGRKEAPRRQEAPRSRGLHLPGAGDQPAAERAGGRRLARLKWARRLRRGHQATGHGLCPRQALPEEVLRQRGGDEFGRGRLQPLRALRCVTSAG